jgi:uncharacterized protein YndB with AHSA1/START domain
MVYIVNWLDSTDRQVRRGNGGNSAVLRRRYDAPVEKVWNAWTDRAQLTRWLGKIRGEVRSGCDIEIDIGTPEKVNSRILRLDPQRRLVMTWTYAPNPLDPADEVDLRLIPDGEGTILELQHRSIDESAWWVGAGPGWEDWLIRLNALLPGEDPAEVPSNEIQPQLEMRWAMLTDPGWKDLLFSDARETACMASA